MRRFEAPIPLEPTDDDAGRHALGCGELGYRWPIKIAAAQSGIQCRTRQQGFAGERVCCFLVGASKLLVGFLDHIAMSTGFEQMPNLVEEAEPELILAPMSKGQNDPRIPADPADGPTGRCA